ncbi:PfkB family carbohydrate kinase [Kitasatospora sp. HPMI-4]|uniref:PfkB family carbohydrate kinase n=1 Tax=Kitasatospora sp. HPMI-4 TaxID=3448443 RepID=UPI003F1B9507
MYQHPDHRYHVCCRRPLDAAAVLDRLAERGAGFSVDFSLPSAEDMIRAVVPRLDRASTVFVNAAEYRLLQAITDATVLPEVVVTDGPRPAQVWTLGRRIARVAPPSRPPNEVSGAGDTPAGTFLARRSQGATPARALAEAVEAAARFVTTPALRIPAQRRIRPTTGGFLLVSLFYVAHRHVAHRLFAAHDRALAAALADRLAAKVGTERVFLPFCDTDEEDLVAEVKEQRLFELDRERLGRPDAMVALLHGPSLDDGVSPPVRAQPDSPALSRHPRRPFRVRPAPHRDDRRSDLPSDTRFPRSSTASVGRRRADRQGTISPAWDCSDVVDCRLRRTAVRVAPTVEEAGL